ncbi:MAG: DNA repair protein RecO (recombination protein O) [Myxococcota bacterium]|jgi:DNA repair protein RecO (recombination protein O)
MTQALLLRTVDVGEMDRIVHLLTPDHGRVTAMAKSARKSVKRFPGTLDLMNHLNVELQIRPRKMTHLGRAKLITPFLPLREDPARFALGCYLIELLGRLSPEGGAGGDSKDLFDFALATMQNIESVTPDAKMRMFLKLESLSALGLRPELRYCVRCGTALEGGEAFAFHLGEGGARCSRCTGEGGSWLPVHLGTLRTLEQGLKLGVANLDRLAMGPRETQEAEQLVGRFHRFHVGIELRSEAFLSEAFAHAGKAVGGGAKRA